jgi:hypothetical protein
MSVTPSAGSGSTNISQTATFPNELTATMSGSFVKIGTLTNSPVIIIFDNQGTSSVAISVDGVNTWRTFTSGEAMILDLRANHGNAPNFTIAAGTTFFGNGASGTFSISYLSATP